MQRSVWTLFLYAASVLAQAPNASNFENKVYFAGQPTAADLAEYARQGVKTVVNLRTAAEMEKTGFDEAAAVKAAGMRYLHVPIGSTPPADSELARIYTELAKSGQQKVLLHCASSNRVGMVWAVFRGTQQGVAPAAALAEGKTAGLKAPNLEKFAREKLGLPPQ